MSISLDQAYQIFMADRETSCADKTLIYYHMYQNVLTGLFLRLAVMKLQGNFSGIISVTCGSVRSSRTILSWNRPRNYFRLPASGHMPGRLRYLPTSARIMNTVMTLLTR